MFERSLHDSTLFVLRGVNLCILHTDDSFFPARSYYRRTLDCESLACASLTIGKDSAVVTRETAVSNRFSHLTEHLCLRDFLTSNEVKRKGFDVLARSLHGQLFLVLNGHTRLGAISARGTFPLIVRSDADDYLNVVFHGHFRLCILLDEVGAIFGIALLHQLVEALLSS